MKEAIVNQAKELFFQLGFKSVTMDDIAADGGISKKTLYQYFPSKEDLILAGIDQIHQTVTNEIDRIQALALNPAEELLNIRQSINTIVPAHSEDVCMHQLKKYYPSIFEDFQHKIMGQCMSKINHNLQYGIREGFYRPEINIKYYSQFYFQGMLQWYSQDQAQFSLSEWRDEFLDFFLRGILTEKGFSHYSKLKTITTLKTIA